jgi:hypothetical protein
MPKKSPTWMDEFLEREAISWEEYYARQQLDRSHFWAMYWGTEKVLEEWRGFWELVEFGIQETIDKYTAEKAREAEERLRELGKPEE